MTNKLLLYIWICFLLASMLMSCSKSKVLTTSQEDWLKKQDSITVAVFPYYPPYQFINNNEEIDGILIEYLALMEKKINYKFQKKKYTNWVQLLDDAKSNKIDVILEIQQTEDKAEYLNFYTQLFESKYVIITRKDTSYDSNILDSYNKVITVPEEYGIHEILKNNHPNLKIVTHIDELTCIKTLSSGKYDAYIAPKAVANYLMKTKNLNNIHISGNTKYSYKPSVAVIKQNSILNEIIYSATESISTKEERVILDNWLFNIITPFYKDTQFWVFFSVVIILLLITITLINRYLKTKIKQKTKELTLAKEIAEENNRLKTTFLQNISHEIRTPMNGIIGFSEFLNDPNITIDERKRYTNIIINSGKQLMGIIDDILEISKLQTQQVSVKIEPTDINNVLQTICATFQTKANEKNVSLYLKNELSKNQSFILIDNIKLTKILKHLIDNAIKFTSKGYIEILCRLKNEKTLMFSIKDTGIGINSRDQELIFKSFSQLEKELSKNYGGLGLGLTIAKENTDLIGGMISHSSVMGEGSIFSLTVPYYPIYQNNTSPLSSHKNKQDTSGKHVVLIAEDGNINFLFLKTILSKMINYDFLIHRVENGKEAVDFCRENLKIDLVFMDIKMPIMDGYDATKEIKKMRPDLLVIAQTAYSTEEDIQKALAIGCDDFISKPIDRKVLKPMLDKYLSAVNY